MIIVATQKNSRQPARKVRYVADVVKKMSIEEAIRQLAVMERRSSLVVLKTLRQAIANATNNRQLQLADLQIKNIVVDEAPTYKRWRAVSRGRAHTILKRSCHVKVELMTEPTEKQEGIASKAKATNKTKVEVKQATSTSSKSSKTQIKSTKAKSKLKTSAAKKPAKSTAKKVAKPTKKTTKAKSTVKKKA